MLALEIILRPRQDLFSSRLRSITIFARVGSYRRLFMFSSVPPNPQFLRRRIWRPYDVQLFCKVRDIFSYLFILSFPTERNCTTTKPPLLNGQWVDLRLLTFFLCSSWAACICIRANVPSSSRPSVKTFIYLSSMIDVNRISSSCFVSSPNVCLNGVVSIDRWYDLLGL